jgi:hypothetical protein
MQRLTPVAAALAALLPTSAAWSQSAPGPSPDHPPAAPAEPQRVTIIGAADAGDFNVGGVSRTKLPTDPHDLPQSFTVLNQVSKRRSGQSATELRLSATTNGLVRTTVDHAQRVTDSAAWRVAAMAQGGALSTRDAMKSRDYGVTPSLRLGKGTPAATRFAGCCWSTHSPAAWR